MRIDCAQANFPRNASTTPKRAANRQRRRLCAATCYGVSRFAKLENRDPSRVDLASLVSIANEIAQDYNACRRTARLPKIAGSPPPMPLEHVKIGCVTDELFGENCYILHLPGRGDCLVVDPGLQPADIVAYCKQQQLAPAAILNTHGHCDHIAGNAAMKQHWPAAPIIIGKHDEIKLSDAAQNLSAAFGVPMTSPPADRTIVEGETISFAGFDLLVREIPGHSIGHVVFLWQAQQPAIVLGGDVLMAGSVGRTDFPDGDFEQLAARIHEKLFELPEDALVLPGHGPATTIGREKRSNPFVGAPAGYLA
jgi:glyoxylase-like metal-dependent hydrolase (beta-lactamase superfamily II)